MKKEIRDKWCEALRGGEYEQTKEALQDGSAYCCIGVLCELAARAGIYVERILVDDIEIICGGELCEQPAVDSWARLEDYIEEELISLNDNGASFPEIADEIEKLVDCEESSEPTP